MIEKLNPAYKTYRKYIPPGGHVEFSEKLEEACAREMEEETGLIVSDLDMRGAVTFLREGYHSVCFFFIAHHVEGELVSNEPDKQTAHWVELEGIEDNEKVPGYHKDFLRYMLQEHGYMNARVEWFLPEDRVEWTIMEHKEAKFAPAGT